MGTVIDRRARLPHRTAVFLSLICLILLGAFLASRQEMTASIYQGLTAKEIQNMQALNSAIAGVLAFLGGVAVIAAAYLYRKFLSSTPSGASASRLSRRSTT